MSAKDKAPSKLEITIAKNVYNLLEDYEVISTNLYTALIPRYSEIQTFSENIRAAIIASSYRLASIDYAKKRYCKSLSMDETFEKNTEKIQYIGAYKSAKNYILSIMSKFSDEERDLPLPSSGVFGASIVLERLPSSFFSAHILYSLGHRYEGHAISRLILEQLAWAYTACHLENVEHVERIVTTKTISKLKKDFPAVGKIYGFLSNKTHIDYKSHFDFLSIEESKNVLKITQHEYYEYAEIILCLADLFGIIWEISQHEYLSGLETCEIVDGVYSVKKDRPFLNIMNDHLNKIRELQRQSPTK